MSRITKSHDDKKHYANVRISDNRAFSVRSQKPKGSGRTTISITADTPQALVDAVTILIAELEAIRLDAVAL